MNIPDLLELAQQNPTLTARRAGIARSTLLRVSSGKTQPSLTTLQEIALSLGLSANITITPASEPTVAFAVRYMLDETIPEPSPQTLENISTWAQRFQRWDITQPEDLVQKAGQLSNITQRSQARFFAPKPSMTPHQTALRAASAADAAQTGWALSGQAAANRLLDTQDKGPLLLWVQETETTANFLKQSLTEQADFTPTSIVLLPALNGELLGASQEKNLHYVADLQAVIDLHSLGFSATAQRITADWTSA